MLKTQSLVHDITNCKVENSVNNVENPVERVDNLKKSSDTT